VKIAILTTYCERPDLLKKLVQSVKKAVDADRYEIDHYILDDASEKVLGSLGKYEESGYTIFVTRHEIRYGRPRYWETMNELFGQVKDGGYDFIFSLQDDMEVCTDFFDRAFHVYSQVPKNSMLMFLLDDRVMKRDAGFTYQIIDGCASMIPSQLLNAIGWVIEPIPSSRTRMSSGVWRQLSYRLVDESSGARIFYSNYSLAYHHGDESQLNPSTRGNKFFVTRRWIDELKPELSKLKPISRWKGLEFEKQVKGAEQKVLLVTTEGIGNVIQMVPLYLQMVKKWKIVDVCHHDRFIHEPQVDFWKVIAGYFGNKAIEMEDAPSGRYDFQISRSGRSIPEISLIFNCSAQAKSAGIFNEVGWSVNCCSSLGLHCERPDRILQEVLPIDWKEFRGDDFNDDLPEYDIVFCNGSANHNATWLRKKYQRYSEVAKTLEGKFTMASVGNSNEYIYGTDDMIHLSFLDTLDLISKSRLFVGNDTGLYHFANLIGKRNVVVFTATSTIKNYNSQFHEFSKVVQGGCPSRTYCQMDDGTLSQKWAQCITWQCAYFGAARLVSVIEEEMIESFFEKAEK